MFSYRGQIALSTGNSTLRRTPIGVSSGELSGNIGVIIFFLHWIGEQVYLIDSMAGNGKHH